MLNQLFPMGGEGAHPRILVVGGDEEGVRTLRRAVRHAGYRHVTHSREGTHAVLMAMKHQPKVAIIETSVPGMNAYEVAERLQNLPVGGPVPVILIAWERDQVAQIHAKMVGAFGVLESPYEQSDLARMLEEALTCMAPA